MCTFGLSGCRVKPRRPHQTGPPGLAHDNQRTPNAHIRGSWRFKNTTKIPREDTQRDTERAKRWREREEKARNFGPPTLRGPPPFGPPPLRGPTLSGPHPFGAPPFGAPLFQCLGPPPIGAPPIGAPPFGAPPFWAQKGGAPMGKTLKHQNWPKSVWPKSVNTLKH